MQENPKAEPDIGTLNVEASSKAEVKVALDLEDAPFLQDETPPAPAVEAKTTEAAGSESVDVAEDDGGKKKKRLIVIAGAALLLLLLLGGGGALWWFVLRTPPSPSAALKPEIIKVPSPPVSTAPTEHVLNFEPFWVEQTDKKGELTFLACKFAAIATDAKLVREAQNKMPVLRDALYYYLRNKPLSFLVAPENVPAIKRDLASVLSGYLAGGKIDDMLFESYLGK